MSSIIYETTLHLYLFSASAFGYLSFFPGVKECGTLSEFSRSLYLYYKSGVTCCYCGFLRFILHRPLNVFSGYLKKDLVIGIISQKVQIQYEETPNKMNINMVRIQAIDLSGCRLWLVVGVEVGVWKSYISHHLHHISGGGHGSNKIGTSA